MCGRMVAKDIEKALKKTPGRTIREVFASPPKDRFNLAPTQEAVTLGQVEGEWIASMRCWGLIPSWAKDAAIGVKLINARAETLAEKPSFRKAFRQDRILIPVSGFYEWAVIAGKKRPYFIHPSEQDGHWLFAGLGESWAGPEGPVASFTVITTGANEAMSELHHRMPVILGAEEAEAWMNTKTPESELLSLLKPCPGAWVEAWEVGSAVGNVKHDFPELIEPVAVP